MPDHVVREIRPRREALGALQSGSLSPEKVAQSSGKPETPGSGNGSWCQSGATFG